MEYQQKVQYHQFEAQVAKALEAVKRVLDASRRPQIACEVHHSYDDKYLLVEFLVNTAIASQLNCLAHLGLTPTHLQCLRNWATDRRVSFKFRGSTCCAYLREESREEEGSTKIVIDEKVDVAGQQETKHVEHKVVTTIKTYFWRVDMEYELIAYSGVGSDPAESITLLARKGSRELSTVNNRSCPREPTTTHSGTNLDITWLLTWLDPRSCAPCFSVDRNAKECATPRRNPQVDGAIEYFERGFTPWAVGVKDYIVRHFGQESQKFSPSRFNEQTIVENILEPVLPLLEDSSTNLQGRVDDNVLGAVPLVALAPTGRSDGQTVTLAVGDANRFLAEEWRSLEAKCEEIKMEIGSGGNNEEAGVFTAIEGGVTVSLLHAQRVAAQLCKSLVFVENMLRSQLTNAIGRELTSEYFGNYMKFHNRKLFHDAYQPEPFCYPVRRSDRHAPEGTLSIEEQSTPASSIVQPVVTITNSSTAAHTMQFPLGAATKVSFTGTRHLHAICLSRFAASSDVSFNLEARARQFSSMIVLVGSIASTTLFEPKYAAIVQNKDELTVPLRLSTIPTPKEFRDAIESLSSEQQAFAKAFRAMQLESSLFAVLVIQIKPQMEKLLRLPEDSLTKEVLLNQELTKLFIEYQISSDLLSFTGPSTAEVDVKLQTVRSHVNSIQDILKKGRHSEISEFKARAQEALLDAKRHAEQAIRELREEYARRKQEEEQRRRSSIRQKESSCRQRRASPQMMRAMRCEEAMAVAVGCAPMMWSQNAELCDFIGDAGGDAGECLELNCAVEADEAPGMEENGEGGDEAVDDQKEQMQDSRDGGDARDHIIDYTQLPKELDRRFEEFDEDNCVRPTIISPDELWTKRSKAGLLSTHIITETLGTEEQKREREKAFDLLDALTKSGSLTVDHASLHVVLAATHCFDQSIIETVIQGNKNPIEKIERSTLIMATTIHRQPASKLVNEAHLMRLHAAWPHLCDASRSCV